MARRTGYQCLSNIEVKCVRLHNESIVSGGKFPFLSLTFSRCSFRASSFFFLYDIERSVSILIMATDAKTNVVAVQTQKGQRTELTDKLEKLFDSS